MSPHEWVDQSCETLCNLGQQGLVLGDQKDFPLEENALKKIDYSLAIEYSEEILEAFVLEFEDMRRIRK